MKLFNLFLSIILVAFISSLFSCRPTKNINKAIAKKDTVVVVKVKEVDSAKLIKEDIGKLKKNYINFKTFSAKIKIDYEDNNGKQPDILANVRIIKDSAIWVSLSATFLNIEVYRALITKDSVILVNKQAKEVNYRSLDYLQEITSIPFDYYTLQDLLVGNPIFMDSNIVSYKKNTNEVLISMLGKYFKNLLTLSTENYLVQHSKLDDVDFTRNRTADITYSEYELKNGISFSSYREITVSEKNKLDIRLNYKNYEFNKDLSVSFNIPKNYKRK